MRIKWVPVFILLACTFAGAQKKPGPPVVTEKRAAPIFVFHTDEFWLNLHHFLYVLGRADNKTSDSSREAVAGVTVEQDKALATLKPSDQAIWREAVVFYAADLSKRDLVFDASLSSLTNALAKAGDAPSLSSVRIDKDTAAMLERAAPTYRKAWWPMHHAANRAWQASIEKLVAKYGNTILVFITDAYKLEWPATGFPVNISAYSNWAGAYSTTGNLLVLSSQSVGTQGDYGLETIFHEGMHQWDEQVIAALRQQSRRVNKIVPQNLSHALIFFTAGEAVRQVLPDHVPYAIKFGVWQRGIAPFKAALEELWKPYLEKGGRRDDVFAEIIGRVGVEPSDKAQ